MSMEQAIALLRGGQRVAVLTGAGTSAESGVPTFREAQTGLWAQYDPTELATPEAFERNPRLVWEWYQWRHQLCQKAQPNPGHHALAQMESTVPELTLITQNVDAMHQRAGSTGVIELHGCLMRFKCASTGKPAASWTSPEVPPRHPETGGLLRPDVVWFGEGLPPHALQAAMVAATECDVFLSIGTSTVVYPAAELPFAALRGGATVIEINPNVTPLTPEATMRLAMPSGEALPQLLAGLTI